MAVSAGLCRKPQLAFYLSTKDEMKHSGALEEDGEQPALKFHPRLSLCRLYLLLWENITFFLRIIPVYCSSVKSDLSCELKNMKANLVLMDAGISSFTCSEDDRQV